MKSEVGSIPTLSERLDQVCWSSYETAYGSAKPVRSLLLDLFSEHQALRMNAAHELWSGLCHQHAFISSAAVPALPFLFERLMSADRELTIELLDIFAGFAVCSRCQAESSDWARVLHAHLAERREVFLELANHADEEIRDFAQDIVDMI